MLAGLFPGAWSKRRSLPIAAVICVLMGVFASVAPADWSPTQQLAVEGVDRGPPVVALGSPDQGVVLYGQTDFRRNAGSLMASELEQGRFTTPEAVVTHSGGIQPISASLDQGGNLLVGAILRDPSFGQGWLTVLNRPVGEPFGQPRVLSHRSTDNRFSIATSQSGHAVAAWADERSGKVRAAQGAFNGEFERGKLLVALHRTVAPGPVAPGTLVIGGGVAAYTGVDGAGRATVVWNERKGRVSQIVARDLQSGQPTARQVLGTSHPRTTLVGGQPVSYDDPAQAVAASPGTATLVAWQSYGTKAQQGVWIAARRGGSSRLGPARRVTRGAPGRPLAAIDAEGNTTIVWASCKPGVEGPCKVSVAVAEAAGPTILTQRFTALAEPRALVMNQRGDAALGWDTHDGRVEVRTRSRGGLFGPPHRLEARDCTPMFPFGIVDCGSGSLALGIDSAGGVVAAWQVLVPVNPVAKRGEIHLAAYRPDR